MKTGLPNKFFNTEALVKVGNEMLQLVAKKYDEVENLEHPVVPKILPGFIRSQLPSSPPQQGEALEDILKDTQDIIFPGSTLWNHPNFFAYYPSNMSHSAVIAEIFATAFGTPGFQWIVNPVQTELENLICDWVVQALDLPEIFLIKNSGGGTISTTVSDSVFLSVHVAKRKKMKELSIDERDPRVLKLVGYYTQHVHACSFQALYLKDIPYQKAVPVVMNDVIGNLEVDLVAFEELLKKDLEEGLIPFWYGANYGTTATCGYDQIDPLGDLAKKYSFWLNVDAAYAGPSWVIPEYRAKAPGLEKADSIQINFGKLMMVGLIGCFTFVADKKIFTQNLVGKADTFEMYKNRYTDEFNVVEYRDWQISLGRRFNALKMWWVFRSFGIEGLRENIQTKIDVSRYFEKKVLDSKRFKIYTKGELTLSTFLLDHQSLEEQNKLNKKLYNMINEDTSKGFISATSDRGVFFLRFVVCNHTTTNTHVDTFWNHVNELADKIINDEKLSNDSSLKSDGKLTGEL